MTPTTLQAYSAPVVKSDTITVQLRIDGLLVCVQGSQHLMRDLGRALVEARGPRRPGRPGAPVLKPSGHML